MWNKSALMLALYCGICYCFVLSLSATTGLGDIAEGQFFATGKSWSYKYTTRIILNEKGWNQNDIGFMMGSQVTVESIWASEYARILKITLGLPQVFIRSKGAEGFSSETTPLESMPNAPFYVLWQKGVVEKFLVRKEEPIPMINLKKGIASLFQFQLLDMETKETDASGECKVLYMSVSTQKVKKAKLNCINEDLSSISNPELLLSAKLHSLRTADYEISKNNEFIESIRAEEIHEMYLPAKEEIGNKVEVHQTLDFVDSKPCDIMKEATYEEVKQKLIDDIGLLAEENLLTHREVVKKGDDTNFVNAINKNRDSLKASNLGKLVSAQALIPLIQTARSSHTEVIAKALTSKKNQKILSQIYDILGYAQTFEAHNAVMKKLHFDDEKQIDAIERYLWSSSLSTQPNPDIITDLLSKYKKTQNIPKKIQETLLLTIASMTHRLSRLPTKQSKLINNVQETIIINLDVAKGEERIMFLRALRNLKVLGILPKLLEVIKTGTQKEVVLAWKAIRAMEPSSWTKEVLSAAQRTYYQLDKTYDSSSRTLAADVILETNPSDETLKGFLYYLIKEDKQFEVKQYVFQQIKMLSDDDPLFKKRVLRIITSDDRLNNYSTLSPKGLSIALRRKFMESTSSNGSLLTVQEMSSGIVKRGVVNVMMDKEGHSQEIFSLGIFSGGLGSFLGGEESESEDSATAGMELSVLGTQIRPFTFFEGQGDLMGHVWSGTASERTTAFQALILLQDHQETLRLGSGLMVDVDVKGGASFDLAGRIEFSLWSRNAQALIEKSVGFVSIGSMRLETSFVNLEIVYQMTIEPNLLLNADIDFSSNVAICLRLSQPDSIFRHEIRKMEQIPTSKHTIRRLKKRKVQLPGRTYVLNKKNNEMCGAMFR